VPAAAPSPFSAPVGNPTAPEEAVQPTFGTTTLNTDRKMNRKCRSVRFQMNGRIYLFVVY
jgi:hypothetical protein